MRARITDERALRHVCDELAVEAGQNEDLAQRYADALIAIVGREWPRENDCPYCIGYMFTSAPTDRARHGASCPWLIAARALGCV